MHKKIETSQAPSAIGPYSQAIFAGGFVFTSGQIPLVPKTGEICTGGITDQAKQVLENLQAVLLAGNSSCDLAVKTTCYLTDMAYFQEFNAVYEQYFDQKPARTCIACRELPKGALCEVECIALVKDAV